MHVKTKQPFMPAKITALATVSQEEEEELYLYKIAYNCLFELDSI